VVVVWIAFIAFVLLLLALDLGVFHRRAHVVSVREALAWSVVWIATALAFAVFVYFGYEHHWLGLGLRPDPVDRSAQFADGRLNDGRAAVLKYLTGYIVEKSLSVDNVFVIAMLFSYFAVPRIYQHRVLFWGILGALAMRGVMIAIGAHLVEAFSWVLYVFGVILILTAVKMMVMTTEQSDPGRNVVVRLIRRWFPVTDRFHSEHFVVRAGGAASLKPATPEADTAVADPAVQRARPGTLMLTPLAVALVMVETTDLVFAIDSIPAIFAITADPFLVFTSNVFAILGLRSLYFALAGALHTFRYLKHALAVVLMMVGVKMLAHAPLERALGSNFNLYLLAAVLLILALGVLASLVGSRAEWGERIRRFRRRAGHGLAALAISENLVATIERAAIVQRRLWRRRARKDSQSPRVVRDNSTSAATFPLARDLMRSVPACPSDTTVERVARLMAEHECGQIPVVDTDRHPVGVLTDYDIVCRVVALGRDPAAATAATCMTQPAVAVSGDAPFVDIVFTMETHQVTRVTVVDHRGRFAGVVDRDDLSSAPGERDAAPLRSARTREARRGHVDLDR
jgi:tellurite resistance protein TerC